MFNRKILLIDPPFFRFMDENQPNPPLGLAYLTSYCMERGFSNVVIYNADFNPFEDLGECNRAYAEETNIFDTYKKRVKDLKHPLYKEVLKTIDEQAPDVIGFSLTTAKFFICKNLIKMTKEKNEHIPIIVGGPHATAKPEEVLGRTKADFVVRGEGEVTFYELLKSIFSEDKNYKEIDGISFKKDGEIIHNRPREYIKDLDTIPFPCKDAMLFSEYVDKDNMGGLFSSRGCPFNCAFCDARTTWSRRVRRHSPQNIVEEIIFTKRKYGTTFFSFSDDCFITNKHHTLKLCDLLIQSGLAKLPKKDFRWWCEIHPRFITHDVVSKMKEAGCVAVAMGVEAGSQKTLDKIHKSTTKDMIRNAAKIIKNNGVELVVFCIIGFPWETTDDIEATMEFMRELKPDSGNLSILTPLPSTEIYDYCLEKGLIDFDADYLNCFHQRSSHFYSELIDDEESRTIVKNSFSRIDGYVNENRRTKIVNYLKQIVIPLVFKGESSLNYKKLIYNVDQDYSKKKIDIIINSNINEKLLNEICMTVLERYPQYLVIWVKSREGDFKKKYKRG